MRTDYYLTALICGWLWGVVLVCIIDRRHKMSLTSFVFAGVTGLVLISLCLRYFVFKF